MLSADHAIVAPEAQRLTEQYLPTRKVRARYGGVTNTTLSRWLRNKNFPGPVRLGNRRYWRIGELLRWEAQQAVLKAAQDER